MNCHDKCSWDHLLLSDPLTPEEEAEWERLERQRQSQYEPEESDGEAD
jgi:hypothetical protein